MKKKIIVLIGLFLVVKNKILAQQWAMDEAYDDWREGGQSDARWTVEKFRQLSKADRDAVVKFINAI